MGVRVIQLMPISAYRYAYQPIPILRRRVFDADAQTLSAGAIVAEKIPRLAWNSASADWT